MLTCAYGARLPWVKYSEHLEYLRVVIRGFLPRASTCKCLISPRGMRTDASHDDDEHLPVTQGRNQVRAGTWIFFSMSLRNWSKSTWHGKRGGWRAF